MFNGTIITSAGRKVLAYCIANELPLQFTYMKIGDGVLITETEDELAELTSEKLAVLIEHKSCSNGIYMLRAVFTNQLLSQGFYIRECGVFVNNPETNEDVLFAYDNAGDGTDVDYFSPGNGKVILKEVFEMAASIGNDANVELVINPQLVYITEEEYKAAVKNAGTYTKGTEYKANDVVDYDNGKLLSTVAHTAGTTPDFEKMVWIVPRKKYDYFEMEIDAYNSSNPSVSNGYIKYHGGCEKFTEDDWVSFFGYRPCIMCSQGEIECYLDPNNYTQDINGNSVDITTVSSTPRNVMIEHRRLGIMSQATGNGNWIVRVTNDPADGRYSYGAFENGYRGYRNIYIGAYNGTVSNSKLHSISGASITNSGYSLSTYRTLAKANGNNYQLMDIRKFSFLRHLFILQNGSINGRVSAGFKETNITTGELNEIGLNMEDKSTYWAKWLGMEDNCFSNVIDGNYISTSGRLLIAKNDNFSNTGSGYEDCGYLNTLENGYMGTDVTFSPEFGFIPNDSSGTSGTRFRAATYPINSGTFMINYGYNIFACHFTESPATSLTGVTARLCFVRA